MTSSRGILISRAAAVPGERYSYILVSLGTMTVVVIFADRVVVRTAIIYDSAGLQQILAGYGQIMRVSEAPDNLHLQLAEYLAGNKTVFSCTVRVVGTDFTVDVIKALLQVPFGQRISYGQLAFLAGHPGASRAVGSVMRKNTCPILIPCHRVISSDGGLGSYSEGAGPTTKRFLLSLESELLP